MKRALKEAVTGKRWTVFWLTVYAIAIPVLAWWLLTHPGGCINDC